MTDQISTERPDKAQADQREITFDDVVKRFERELLLAEGCPSVELFIELLDSLEKQCSKGGLLEHQIDVWRVENRYTRVASAITYVATHPELSVTYDQMGAICKRKQQIAYIFNASGYRNMNHLIGLAGTEEAGQFKLSLKRAAVLLCFLGIDDVPDELMQTALAQPPRVLLTLMLGWLNQRAVLTPQGEDNRATLLQAGDKLAGVEMTDRDVGLMVNAWMYCSYAVTPQKHEIKKAFNSLFRDLLYRSGVNPRINLPPRAKPRILVIHERFIGPHAMFRCYAPYVRGLRSKFEVIALAEEIWIDSASDELFDSIYRISEGAKQLGKIAEVVEEIAPDVIWYPSLGMSHWAVLLATLRLAPLQAVTPGHPATTQMDTIDYYYVANYVGDPTAVFSETVLIGKDAPVEFDPHNELPEQLPGVARPSEREVRVAVNSKVMKLTHKLIAICKELERNSKYPVKFIFLPGERHLFFDGLSAAIKAQLPSAEVRPYMGYNTFLKELSKCDLALSSFPFGNTNGAVDTCLLGIPNVVNFGPEAPSQSDALVIEAAGYPTELVAQDDQKYYEIALKLINEQEYRSMLTSQLDRVMARNRLCGNQTAALVQNDFAEQIFAAYTEKQAP